MAVNEFSDDTTILTGATLTLADATASTLLATDGSKAVISNPGTLSPTFAGVITTGNIVNRGENFVVGRTATANSVFTIDAAAASVFRFAMAELDGATDAKTWEVTISGGTWTLRTLNDAFSAAANAISITRTGYSVTGMTLSPPVTCSDDLAVNGGDLTSTATTFNLLNSTPTTVNAFQAATAISIGATTGYTHIRHKLGVGVASPGARLEVQTTSSEATACLLLDQDDVDEEFIAFEGTSGADTTSSISTHATAGSLAGWAQILVNGSKRWIPFYNDPSA